MQSSNNRRTFYRFEDFTPICVEVFEQSEPLTTLEQRENAVYVFGAEDGGVPQVFRRLCHGLVHISSHFCRNLNAAVNAVLVHRLITRQWKGKQALLPLSPMLRELSRRPDSCDGRGRMGG